MSCFKILLSITFFICIASLLVILVAIYAPDRIGFAVYGSILLLVGLVLMIICLNCNSVNLPPDVLAISDAC